MRAALNPRHDTAFALCPQMDPRRFSGLESVPDAVEHLQSGRSLGKVAVQLARELPPAAASRL